MPMSDYLQQQLLTHLLRTGSWTKPTELWIALHTANPTDAGAGAEVTGGGYARVQRDPADANWTDPGATSGLSRNAAVVTFPTPTGDWAGGADITHFSVWDDETAGNMLIYGPLDDPITVLDGQQAPVIPINGLTVTAV